MKFKGNFREVSMVFQGSFKGIPRKLLGWVKEVLKMFQGRLKGASMEF